MLKISRSSDQSTHRWLQVLLGLTLGIAAVSTLRIYRQQEAFETALSTASEPDICALCGKGGDPIWYHAPCLVNLSTGEVGELTIYDPHRSLVGEIAKTQQTGTFSLLHCAGLTAARDTCNYTCSVTLPQEQDQMAPAFFCLDCRALLAEVAQKGYVLLDLYDLQDITAYGNGKFGPNDPITREQAATMVARLAEAMGDNLPSKATRFTDKFNTWAVEPVSKCYGAGIMNGYSDTAFGAKDGYTIEQSIVSLLRAYEYGKGAGLLPTPLRRRTPLLLSPTSPPPRTSAPIR